MSVELTVISNYFLVQLTKNHLVFGQLGQLNKTPLSTFGSTDRKSSFWYVEPTKEDSMAEFKLSLTKNCLFGTLSQRKKTQWLNSNFHSPKIVFSVRCANQRRLNGQIQTSTDQKSSLGYVVPTKEDSISEFILNCANLVDNTLVNS
jgi:hypothetical protein